MNVSLECTNAQGRETHRIVSLDLLCRHKGPLFDVRHLGGRIDVPIAVQLLLRADSWMSSLSSIKISLAVLGADGDGPCKITSTPSETRWTC
jgi:hypothetical protein